MERLMRVWKVGVLLVSLLCGWATVPHAQLSKAVYLAQYDGSGSASDPFVVRGSDSTTGCIDLRPDPTLQAGWAICGRTTVPASVGIISVASAVNSTLTVTQKTALETRLTGGVALTHTDLPSILAELLIDRAATGRKLLAGSDRKYKIYLGGQVAAWEQTAWLYDEFHIQDGGLVADASKVLSDLASPVLAWAASASENWNCANNSSLTCQLTWTQPVGTGWGITSNQATNTTVGSVQLAYAVATAATADHHVTATRINHSATGGGTFRCGVVGRKANDTAQTFYGFFGNQSPGGVNQHELYKMVAAAQTALGTDPLDVTNGDALTVTADGSNISGSINGSVLIGPITDTAITGNLYGGVYTNSNVTTISCILDPFLIADNTTGSPRRRGMLILP